MVLSLARPTMFSSTTASSSSCSVHRLRPLGGAEQAKAISLASAAPSKMRGLAEAGECLRTSTASKPSSTSCWRVRATVPTLVSRAAAIRLSLHPSPASDASALGIMAALRKVVEISSGDADAAKLHSIARSRTEPASRVERARILLRYRDDPSYYAVDRAVGVTHQTVQRCLARATRFGVMAALDDSPRPGKDPEITLEARAWLVSLACQKAKDVGYPHELWTTRLLARHARKHGPTAGHVCLARIAQGTVCKILADQEVKPHKVRYYLERRDPAFEAKMAEVLCVYREVAILRAAERDAAEASPGPDPGATDKTEPKVAFVS